MRHVLLALILVPLLASPTLAQEVKLVPSGEYLARFRHTEGLDYAPGNVKNFVRHRARLGLRFTYGEELAAFVQLQDVRTWGEETDTLNDYSANGLDLHQGWLEIGLCDDIKLRIGRQEIGYLNHRLIGNVGFFEQARSFDGVRFMAVVLDERLVLDAFYARVRDQLPPESQTADDLFAWTARYDLGVFQPALIGVLDLNSATDRVRYTQGLMLQADFAFGLKLSFEGYLQAGGATIEDADVSYLAWMTATRARFTLVDSDVAPFLEIFVETLSGDDDPTDGDEKTFDTLFATNHRFYGEADVFLNIPAHTGKRGLLDVGASFGMKLGEKATAQIAFHHFAAMDARDGDSDFGQEVDVTFGWKPNPYLNLDLNYSLIVPGALLAADGDVEHFIYTTAQTLF